MSKKFLPRPQLSSESPAPLCLLLLLIPPRAPSQPLSLKSMELIPVGLMDFAAKVRRMHFNPGKS